MRFLVIVKADERSEAGELPTEQELAEMGAFNEELVSAGAMLGGEGLLPSSRGARVRYANGTTTVTDGPFDPTRDLVSGFWLLEARSKEEVVEWMRRAPFKDGEVEIRQVAEADDFGEAFTPELRAQEDRLRAEVAAQHGG